MSNPTEEQINKRIAGFVGDKVFKKGGFEFIEPHPCYARSTEYLIPVAEKVYSHTGHVIDLAFDGEWSAYHGDIVVKNKSPSMALATAIYHVLESRDE